MNFIISIIFFAFQVFAETEYVTSRVSSTSNCNNVQVVAALLKNETLTATCDQVLQGVSITPNTCSSITNTTTFGSLGCTESLPNEYAVTEFPQDVNFIGFMTYSTTDSSCSKPLAGTFVVPDGECKTPFWPGPFDIDSVKSYKVSVDTSQTINVKTYPEANCKGTVSELNVPGAFINVCNNLSGPYAKIVKGTGTKSNDTVVTTTTTTKSPSTSTQTKQATKTSDSSATRLDLSLLMFGMSFLVTLVTMMK